MEKEEAALLADKRFEEKAPEEEEILRYEQDITELLLTITNLHSQIEHLQHQKAREEEDFSDLGSEYMSSLPRYPRPFPNVVLALPPLARSEEGHADLFLDVHKAMTSLENTVLSHRSHIPSTDAELNGDTQVAEGLELSLWKFQGDAKEPLTQLHGEEEASAVGLLPGEMNTYKREMILYEQRNKALKVALEGKDEALRQSKTTICTYQEERDKLQRKVKELQDALCNVENLADGFTSHVQEGGPWRFQQSQQPVETHTIDTDAQIHQLHRFVEKLKCVNQLLLATLQECKSDSERLSMLLGCRESDTTALCLAVQYSEQCLEAYEEILSLTTAQQQHPWRESAKDGDEPITAPDDLSSVCHEVKMATMNETLRSWERCRVNSEGSRCANFQQSSPEPSGLEKDRKDVLQDYIRHLRTEQASLKLPAARTPFRADSAAARINAGIGAKIAEVQRALCDVLNTEAQSPKVEKSHLVQELQATREALADLNIQLHLMGKEKQGLELLTYTLKAQEAACLLIIRILQGDCEKSRGHQSGSSDSSSSSSSDEDSDLRDYIPMLTSKGSHFRLAQGASGRQPATDPEVQTMELRKTLARNRELYGQIQLLLGELEEKLEDCQSQEIQLMELTRDFLKAHSTMVHAYQNAQRKQDAQVRQLETQIGLMRHRQGGQLQSLMRTLQRLEGRADGWAPHAGLVSGQETPSPAREHYNTRMGLVTDADLNVK